MELHLPLVVSAHHWLPTHCPMWCTKKYIRRAFHCRVFKVVHAIEVFNLYSMEVFNLVIPSRQRPPPYDPTKDIRRIPEGMHFRHSGHKKIAKLRSSYAVAKLEVTFEHRCSGVRKRLEQIMDIINTPLLHANNALTGRHSLCN